MNYTKNIIALRCTRVHLGGSRATIATNLRSSLPNLVDQIQRRGRDYEDNIRLDYLKQLNQYYNNWIDNYREGELLILEVDDLNFADKQEDFSTVITKIDSQLFGLF